MTGNGLINRPAPVRQRPGRWHLSTIIDGHALRVKLTTALKTHNDNHQLARAEILDLLHAALFRGRLIAQERLQQGADGLDTARLLSAVQDEVLHALYDYTITHVFRAPNPTQGERLAIFATGGYGRGVLAPSSDVDLLFIRPYKASAHAESLLEYMLYALWDIGLKIGHAFRTPDECVQLARKDVTIKTSLLDARFLFGDRELADETGLLFRKRAIYGENASFIADKLAEREARHERVSPSRYVVEPDIKNGKGGLRDLQTLYWIIRHIHPDNNTGIPEDVVKRHMFTKAEYHTFMRAARFLWTVRCHLHYLTGRAEERLSFDLQPEIAARMHYHDRKTRRGVERFMKRYFLAARDIGSLTRILTARLEAEHMAPLPSWRRFWHREDKKNLSDPLFALASHNRIIIRDEQAFLTAPDAMLRLFRIADRMHGGIHPDALALITKKARQMNAKARTHPETIKVFFAILLDSYHLTRTLNRMNETGILGRFLPEFGSIVAQTQFNMYHHYTVDEHTIRALGHIASMEKGETGYELAGKLYSKITNRRALYLAMLLHDTGKGLGDQQIEGMKTARRASIRLGLDESETECVVWLVGNHLEMSEMAQKRDIADPRTIATLAEKVGNIERLRLLYLLTIADIRAVGPNVWNSWKGQLLSGLYHNTETMLRGKKTDEKTIDTAFKERAATRRKQVEDAIKAPLPAIMLEMDQGYWTGFDTQSLIEHAELLRRKEKTIVAARQRDIAGGIELFISTPDQAGLFARLVSAIAGQGANIVSAQVFTGQGGQAIDIFIVQGAARDVFVRDQASHLQALETALHKAIAGNMPPKRANVYRNDRKAAFIVKPQVTLSENASLSCTVIDIAGRDRPGLLGDVGGVLAAMDVSIVSAHVGSYGERVFDAFYVRLPDGFDEAMKATLKTRLLAAIGREEPQKPTTPAQDLKRARAADSF